jgi:uncharacterized protein
MSDKFISSLYNRRQLLIASMIGGLIMISSVIGLNLWAQNKKKSAIITIVSGVIFEFILTILVYLIIFNLLNFSNDIIRRQVLLVFLLISHIVLALLVQLYLNKKREILELSFPNFRKDFFDRNTLVLVLISTVSFFSLVTIQPNYLPLLFIYLTFHIYGVNLTTKTFGNSSLTNFIKAILVGLACLFPAIFMINWVVYQFATSRLIVFEYIYLGLVIYIVFLLYVLIFFLAIKLLSSINKLVKITPLGILKNRTVRVSIILFCIITPIGITIYGYFANNNPIVSKYLITVPKKSSELTNLKVVCVADIHLKNTTSNKFIKELSKKITELQPDILLIPGDILESFSKIKSVKKELFKSYFTKINPKYGIYLSLGNHDFIEKAKFYKEMNMILLKDSLIEVENKFQVLGLKYRGNNEIRPIDSLLNNSLDLPLILLDHAPYCLDKAIDNKVDIQFSGHTHNGQIWPFNYITSLIFELDWGYKKIDNTNIFVTCGVQDGLLPLRQNASIPIRTGSYSEIIEVDIKFE